MLKRIFLLVLLAVGTILMPAGCVRVGDNGEEPMVDIEVGDDGGRASVN